MHLTEGQIRARHDEQLDPPAARRVDEHLAACEQCREAAAAIDERARRARILLVASGETVPQLNPAAARRKLDERLRQEQDNQEKQTMFQKLFGKISRPVWAGLALIVVLAVALAFPQVRAAADSFLQLFRVEQVRVLPVDMESLSQEMHSSQQLETLFAENAEVEGKGERVDTASYDEAAALAGFPLRRLNGAEGERRYLVEPGATLTFKVDLEMARAVLHEMGRDDILLPDSLDGAVVRVDASTSVATLVGECASLTRKPGDPDQPQAAPAEWPACTTLMQSPSPEISAPPEMDLNGLGKIYLQVLGMTEEEAELYSGSVDWATTLVLPVPQGSGDYEEVGINGVKGIYVGSRYRNSQEYTLMWVQDGIVYVLAGEGSRTDALNLAASIQ